MRKVQRLFICLLALVALSGCIGTPETVRPVDDFYLPAYLGKWYEVARLDHSFERGLTHVTAEYSELDDGSVQVINRGWDEEEQAWQEAVGNAKFVEQTDIGHLKVSFWGPFYSSYVVFYLEEDYSAALVTGYNTDYFWILSRAQTLPDYKMKKYLRIAKQAGINTDELIFPYQDK
ncbi:lipocalin family protein [Vibrio mexicanus]|uniref:lipocalin family protein n=1 Tax=Vibrio mexicanus TaxID=1004326 RepID=UPI00063C26FF|nr:lipocalin family protein [Vibrio mexicanus]